MATAQKRETPRYRTIRVGNGKTVQVAIIRKRGRVSRNEMGKQ